MNGLHFPDPLRSGLTRPKLPPPLIGGGMTKPIPNIFNAFQMPQRRSVFISYHHGNDLEPGDQYYYDQLSRVGSEKFRLMSDNSLDRKVDSTNVAYVMQRIRDNHITGSTCTIVLCGAKTFERKYVDWEIKATLDKGKGLIGVSLPTAITGNQGGIIVPDRLHANIRSGYALWITWDQLTRSAESFKSYIEQAVAHSENALCKSKIINVKEIKKKNG